MRNWIITRRHANNIVSWFQEEDKRLNDNNGICPERTLLVAILEQAYLDAISTDNKFRHDARGWFFKNCKEPWCFLWVSDYLDLGKKEVKEIIEGIEAKRKLSFSIIKKRVNH